MADKKTGSARRPSRDEDEAPKKKQSGTQKPIKKGTSARKAASEDDEEEAPRPAKKGSSARASRGESARSGGGPPKKGPDNGKIFLYFVPGIILLLLGFGAYLAMLPEEKPKGPVTISFDSKVAEAKQKYVKAKAAYQDGSTKEGGAGVPKLIEAYDHLSEGLKIIRDVRKDLKKLETSTDPNVQVKDGQKASVKNATSEGYQFDRDETEMMQLKIMVRKAVLERDDQALKSRLAKEHAEEDAAVKDDDLLK